MSSGRDFEHSPLAIGLALLGLGVALLASGEDERLKCMRGQGRGRCEWEGGSRALRRTYSWDPISIRAVEFRDIPRAGKTPRRAHTAMLDAAGRELRVFALTDIGRASSNYREIKEFFDRPEKGALRIEEPAAPGPVVIGVVLLLAGAIMLLRDLRLRRGPSSRSPEGPERTSLLAATGSPWASSPTGRLSIAAGAVAIGGLASMMAFQSMTLPGQGAAYVKCVHRCRLGRGSECLPGGSFRKGLAPGRYRLEVFSPSAKGGWETVSFDVVAGQTVEVECRPRAGSASK